MWRLGLAIKSLEALTMRCQARLAALNIDDDVALALKLLRKARAKATEQGERHDQRYS